MSTSSAQAPLIFHGHTPRRIGLPTFGLDLPTLRLQDHVLNDLKHGIAKKDADAVYRNHGDPTPGQHMVWP